MVIKNLKKHLVEVITFAFPLIFGQVSNMLLGVEDMMVAGRYSKEALAALGVANATFGPFLMVGLGLSYAITPMLAKVIGENKDPTKYLFTSLIYSSFFSLILMILMILFVQYGGTLLGLNPEIEKPFLEYFWINLFSLFPFLIFQAIKEFLQVQKDIWFANIVVVLANISNIIFNIILCFGLFGFPEMGVKGLAIATLFNRTLMMLALVYYTRKHLFKKQFIYKDFFMSNFKLGLPIAVSILMEVSIFTVVTLLIGRMDVATIAAHNIVLNIVSFTFMVPLALGNTASTLVSLSIAKNERTLAKTYSLICVFLSVAFMSSTALIFGFLDQLVLSIYTDKAEVIAVGGILLFYAALFQIPDGVQTALSGILRGLRITKATMILTMVGYWGIGLPLGLLLCFKFDLGAKGLWIGLSMALTVMMILLSYLVIKYFKKPTALDSFIST
jgi:MATE family multidrug resistance protein